MRTIAQAAVLVLGATLALTASDRQLTPESVYRAYANGDDLAVERWIIPLLATDSPHGNLPQLQASAPWDRMAAAFLLEIAAAHPATFRAISALQRGLSMFIKRPTALGADPIEDRFEMLWHQAALGIAQQHYNVRTQLDYLAAIVPRVEAAQQRRVSLSSRVPLARAMAAAIACCDQRIPPAMRNPSAPDRLPVTLESALEYFDAAARQADLRTEALARSAKLLYDAGRHPQALERFERVPADLPGALAFVTHLTHARVLDSLDRPADAVRAYERALVAEPDGQLAAAGLAAALFRSGRGEDAARVADAARRMPEIPGRGLLGYSAGDYRFVPEWLAEIRRLRR